MFNHNEPGARSETYENFVKRIKNLSDEELIDIYCDWGAMGSNMDCEEWQFDAVQKELDKRAEDAVAEEAFGRFEWDYNPYDGFES